MLLIYVSSKRIDPVLYSSMCVTLELQIKSQKGLLYYVKVCFILLICHFWDVSRNNIFK